MTGNRNTFQKFQAKTGTITFGNDNSSKILGKGTINLGNKDAATKNVLLIENMKHNILSVSQMCDQGHVVTFTSKNCKIRKEGSRKLVATTSKTPNNIYMLDEIKRERCYLGRIYESWLWHRRMGHIHFDNLVKINKKQVVREMPKIKNLKNNVLSIINMGNIQDLSLRQKSIPLQIHWSLFTLICVDQHEVKG